MTLSKDDPLGILIRKYKKSEKEASMLNTVD